MGFCEPGDGWQWAHACLHSKSFPAIPATAPPIDSQPSAPVVPPTARSIWLSCGVVCEERGLAPWAAVHPRPPPNRSKRVLLAQPSEQFVSIVPLYDLIGNPFLVPFRYWWSRNHDTFLHIVFVWVGFASLLPLCSFFLSTRLKKNQNSKQYL